METEQERKARAAWDQYAADDNADLQWYRDTGGAEARVRPKVEWGGPSAAALSPTGKPMPFGGQRDPSMGAPSYIEKKAPAAPSLLDSLPGRGALSDQTQAGRSLREGASGILDAWGKSGQVEAVTRAYRRPGATRFVGKAIQGLSEFGHGTVGALAGAGAAAYEGMAGDPRAGQTARAAMGDLGRAVTDPLRRTAELVTPDQKHEAPKFGESVSGDMAKGLGSLVERGEYGAAGAAALPFVALDPTFALGPAVGLGRSGIARVAERTARAMPAVRREAAELWANDLGAVGLGARGADDARYAKAFQDMQLGEKPPAAIDPDLRGAQKAIDAGEIKDAAGLKAWSQAAKADGPSPTAAPSEGPAAESLRTMPKPSRPPEPPPNLPPGPQGSLTRRAQAEKLARMAQRRQQDKAARAAVEQEVLDTQQAFARSSAAQEVLPAPSVAQRTSAPLMQDTMFGEGPVAAPAPKPIPTVGSRQPEVQPKLFHGDDWKPEQKSLFADRDEFGPAAADEAPTPMSGYDRWLEERAAVESGPAPKPVDDWLAKEPIAEPATVAPAAPTPAPRARNAYPVPRIAEEQLARHAEDVGVPLPEFKAAYKAHVAEVGEEAAARGAAWDEARRDLGLMRLAPRDRVALREIMQTGDWETLNKFVAVATDGRQGLDDYVREFGAAHPELALDDDPAKLFEFLRVRPDRVDPDRVAGEVAERAALSRPKAADDSPVILGDAPEAEFIPDPEPRATRPPKPRREQRAKFIPDEDEVQGRWSDETIGEPMGGPPRAIKRPAAPKAEKPLDEVTAPPAAPLPENAAAVTGDFRPRFRTLPTDPIKRMEASGGGILSGFRKAKPDSPASLAAAEDFRRANAYRLENTAKPREELRVAMEAVHRNPEAVQELRRTFRNPQEPSFEHGVFQANADHDFDLMLAADPGLRLKTPEAIKLLDWHQTRNIRETGLEAQRLGVQRQGGKAFTADPEGRRFLLQMDPNFAERLQAEGFKEAFAEKLARVNGLKDVKIARDLLTDMAAKVERPIGLERERLIKVWPTHYTEGGVRHQVLKYDPTASVGRGKSMLEGQLESQWSRLGMIRQTGQDLEDVLTNAGGRINYMRGIEESANNAAPGSGHQAVQQFRKTLGAYYGTPAGTATEAEMKGVMGTLAHGAGKGAQAARGAMGALHSGMLQLTGVKSLAQPLIEGGSVAPGQALKGFAASTAEGLKSLVSRDALTPVRDYARKIGVMKTDLDLASRAAIDPERRTEELFRLGGKWAAVKGLFSEAVESNNRASVAWAAKTYAEDMAKAGKVGAADIKTMQNLNIPQQSIAKWERIGTLTPAEQGRLVDEYARQSVNHTQFGGLPLAERGAIQNDPIYKAMMPFQGFGIGTTKRQLQDLEMFWNGWQLRKTDDGAKLMARALRNAATKFAGMELQGEMVGDMLAAARKQDRPTGLLRLWDNLMHAGILGAFQVAKGFVQGIPGAGPRPAGPLVGWGGAAVRGMQDAINGKPGEGAMEFLSYPLPAVNLSLQFADAIPTKGAKRSSGAVRPLRIAGAPRIPRPPNPGPQRSWRNP